MSTDYSTFAPLHTAWQIRGVDIRDRIRAVIAEREDLTVRGVSLAAGLSDSALHKFLTGSTDSLTLKTVDKIAAALGVDARWLAYGEGEPEVANEVAGMMERMPARDRAMAAEFIRRFARTGTHD